MGKVLKLSGKMRTVVIGAPKRNIESVAYHGKLPVRIRRGVHARLALMRLEEYLRQYGQPGDSGTVYDLETGRLYADCAVTVKTVTTHIFRDLGR